LIANRQITPIIFYAGLDGKPYGGVPVGNLTADMREAELTQFNIVVLGNLDATELTEPRARNLVRFVESGGSLVILGSTGAWGENGLAGSALRPVMPVRTQAKFPIHGERPFPVRIADAGKVHPAFAGDSDYWVAVPPILSFFPDAELSAGAQTLVQAESPQGVHPIVVSHRYGDGKVVAILTDSLWKWQLTSDIIESRPYQRFWDQLIGWLLPSEAELNARGIEIFADRESLFLGEKLEIRARLNDEAEGTDVRVQCMLVLPDKREVPYTMSAQPVTTPTGKTYPGYGMPFTAEIPGLYTVTAVGGEGNRAVQSQPISFFVKPFTPESVPRPSNIDVLKTVAKSSGGRFFETPTELDRAMQVLNANPNEEQTVEFKTLWQRWPFIALLMLLLATMWVIRKWQNMP